MLPYPRFSSKHAALIAALQVPAAVVLDAMAAYVAAADVAAPLDSPLKVLLLHWILFFSPVCRCLPLLCSTPHGCVRGSSNAAMQPLKI
jgi:hypothetical protein